MIEAGRALGAFDSSSWIGEVDVPTGVVVTENDQLVAPHRQHKLAASIPGASVHTIAADHLVCAAPDARVRFVPTLVEACADVADRARAGRQPVSRPVRGRY
jgi:3-oxoadipate enol-lactonase